MNAAETVTSSSNEGRISSRDSIRISGGRWETVRRARSLLPALKEPPDSSAAPEKPPGRIIVNVGGVRFETFRSTLRNIPDTRLYWLTETTTHNSHYDADTNEYFFDRHPGVFSVILNYYRTGKLHTPTDVCGPLYEEELAYWGLDEKQIEPCCWTAYRAHRDAQETIAKLDLDQKVDVEEEDDVDDIETAKRFGIEESRQTKRGRCWTVWRPRVWRMLEDPRSSTSAQVVAAMSIIFIVVSILTFCLETHPTFRLPREGAGAINDTWSGQQLQDHSRPHPALLAFEWVCVVVFTVELVVRLVFCPRLLDFFRSLLNWVDLLSVLPFYLEKIIVAVNPELERSAGIFFLKTIRLIRIFRVLRLARRFNGLKILSHTLRSSAKELGLLIGFMIITVLIFACLMYYAETAIVEHPQNNFRNIPIGFWWGIITMTTIGYGDMYPRTALGYGVGSLLSVVGVLALALPVPVIVNNFTLYYSHAQAKQKLPRKQTAVLASAPDALKTHGCGEPATESSVVEQFVIEDETTPTTMKERQRSADSALGGSTGSAKNIGAGDPISVIYTHELLPPPTDYSPRTGSLQPHSALAHSKSLPKRTNRSLDSAATARRGSLAPPATASREQLNRIKPILNGQAEHVMHHS